MRWKKRLMLPKIAFSIMATAILAVWAAGPASAGADPLSGGTARAPGAGHHPAGPHWLRSRPPGGQPAAVITGPVINHGGPVQNAPRVYVVYWGWASDPSGEQSYLNNFLSSAGGTPWLSTVSQYGGGSTGNLLAGTWSDPSSIPASPSDAQIQAEALAAVNHFGTGNSVNVDIVVATPTGHSTAGFNTQFCAYHGALTADPNVAYTNLPYVTDAGSNCGANLVNGPDGTLDGVSIIAGHELAEAITDPLPNVQTAWQDAGANEIGDKCAYTNLDDITTSTGIYAVQPLWSNAANGCAPGSTPVSAPSCDSGASEISCDTTAPGTPSTVTWTIFSQWVTADPSSFSGSGFLSIRCHPGGSYGFAYSWISGGVNYFSVKGGISCRSGPPL
jgi:serine protease